MGDGAGLLSALGRPDNLIIVGQGMSLMRMLRRGKIQAAIEEYDELLTLVKKRKPPKFGHISRSSDLEKTILQSSVKGKRRSGRQKKRWGDNSK